MGTFYRLIIDDGKIARDATIRMGETGATFIQSPVHEAFIAGTDAGVGNVLLELGEVTDDD